MPKYTAPVEDTLFLLFDVLQMDSLANLDGFTDTTPDLVGAVLREGAKFCEQVLQPLNRIGDLQGCELNDNGTVTTPEGFREASQDYQDGGWTGLSIGEEFGGQNLPVTLNLAVREYISSANVAWGLYGELTQGAIAAISSHGTDEQKALYLPKLTSGAWSGTMNLTEPHCGTDLGLMRTKAVPQNDGSYQISGQKIFISAGEHDLGENIVHLVLARIDGAPKGTKGISMFLVPRHLPDPDGNPGARNRVSCGALEHKMGLHGNATCVMNYDAATGWLIGDENRGLNAMFVMMNEARLSIGIQGLGISVAAYQRAAEYARERRQGRSPAGSRDPNENADPLVVHPDVRRMLMEMKSFNEGARALMLWTALKADLLHRSDDGSVRQAADDYLGLMTPVIKGVFTDTGFQNAVKAQQIFGGHGYISESGMEQFVRDARVTMIYEGANGIQALDLVGRKLPKDDGRAMKAFMEEISGFLNAQKACPELADFFGPLSAAFEDLNLAFDWLTQNAAKDPHNTGAASNDFMHLMGLVAIGFMWAKIASVANRKLQNGEENTEFLREKLITGRFFMERVLPETQAHLARIRGGATSMMALSAEAF